MTSETSDSQEWRLYDCGMSPRSTYALISAFELQNEARDTVEEKVFMLRDISDAISIPASAKWHS
jgi:hypothetical protein